jgi:hypothetical protein
MSKMTQKQAVISAVVNVCGEVDGPYQPTKEQRAQVNNILFEGFKSGTIAYDGELPDDTKLKAYVSGVQSNWLRKAKELNGNVQYQAKNPGSRAGSGDAQIKAMRMLLSTKTDAAERAEIQSFIDARLSELKPTKSVTIDVNALPETLRKFAK